MSRLAQPSVDSSRSVLTLAAVIVTYHPALSSLQRLLTLISAQTEIVIVVDNGSPPAVTDWLRAHCDQPILLPENQGLASAQNQGIERARRLGASHVLLLDQDSEPASTMVDELIAAWARLQAEEPPVALIAPQVIDRRRQQPLPFFRADRARLRPLQCDGHADILPIHTAIASGSLIPLHAIDAVGPLRDALFIDLVDIDWCWRAKRQGLPVFAACRATLYHHLGEQPQRVAGRDISIHSPQRSYYFIRNAIWLSLTQPFPLAWKSAILLQCVRRVLFLSLFAAPRLQYLGWSLRACRDALRGRLGPA